MKPKDEMTWREERAHLRGVLDRARAQRTLKSYVDYLERKLFTEMFVARVFKKMRAK